MQAAGIDVVSLSAGEPDFPTPSYVAQAGIAAIAAGKTRYTATSGRPDVRHAARAWWQRVYGVPLADGELMATAGAKPALLIALLTLVEDGDRVLLPAPMWVSYPDLVGVAGGVPITIPASVEGGFVLDPDTLRAQAKAHGAKGIILNYPNNPSGAVASPSQTEALLRVAVECGLWVLADEIYGTLVYDGEEFKSMGTFAFAREHVLLVGGGTKSHTLTGWRIGFLAGPKDLITAAGRVQSQVIGNPCTISQEAVLAMCTTDDADEQAKRRQAFDERRRWVMANVGTIPGWILEPEPRGAFYALFDVRDLCKRMDTDDLGLTRRLLEEAHVALVPGSAFAIPGFVRLSYAAGIADLETAAKRIADFTRRVS